jgi:hypothetical protein
MVRESVDELSRHGVLDVNAEAAALLHFERPRSGLNRAARRTTRNRDGLQWEADVQFSACETEENLRVVQVKLETGPNHRTNIIKSHGLGIIDGPAAVLSEQFIAVGFSDEAPVGSTVSEGVAGGCDTRDHVVEDP